NEVGPGLRGVFGRRAGERDDFRYSPALKRSGIIWTPQTMDTFLADPQKMVPANRMPYAGLPDAGDRADLIIYMLQVFKQLPRSRRYCFEAELWGVTGRV